MDFRFSATQRGRMKLLHRGYGYVRTSRNERNWICDKRNYNCRITCILDRHRGLFVNGKHNHLPLHRLPRGRGISRHYINSLPSDEEMRRNEFLKKVAEQLGDTARRQLLQSPLWKVEKEEEEEDAPDPAYPHYLSGLMSQEQPEDNPGPPQPPENFSP